MSVSAHLSFIIQLGIEPKDINSTAIAGEFVVAKASWQSFWKEQGLVIDSKTLNFYNPLSATSCLTVGTYYFDILSGAYSILIHFIPCVNSLS
jgi:hypothetical protein